MGRFRQTALRAARALWLQPVWDWFDVALQRARNYESTDLQRNGEALVLQQVGPRLRGGTIFDVGASVGDWSRMARAAIGECSLHAFEPSSAAFAELTTVPGVHAHRLALGDRQGTATLRTAEPGASIASLLELRHPIRPFDPRNSETVTVTTLDQFCATHGIERIDFLKLDVEGTELAVLHGAAALLRAHAIGYVQFEFGAAHVEARTFLRDFVDLLEDHHVFRIYPGGLRPLRYRPREERFETANYVAVPRDRIGT